MGLHIEKERAEYWKDSHNLGQYMGRQRFEQIYRYFTIRDSSLYPRRKDEDFTWHLEPVATKIRLSFQQNWLPGSHLAIDESMIPYRGNSSHTVKMKNKPISEGYKVWVLGDHGYVWYFLWYSCVTGTEGIPKKGQLVNLPVPFRPIHLATTFATVIELAAQLRSSGAELAVPDVRVHCLFLDNLFLNQDVCLALLALNKVPEPYPRWRLLPRPLKCVWCREHQGSAAPRAKRRKVLAEVMNEANPGTSAYVPQSRAACECHGVALCRKSDCWDLYHAQIAQNGHE